MDKNGIDCSGLINVATGQTTRVWHTAIGGKPPGNLTKVCAPTISIADFLTQVKEGDIFVWKGHAAFYAGHNKLFHARTPGTVVGFTNDLLIYWLPKQGYPQVCREV
jgi:cell wall-associated NlpC family hydrolase